MGYFRNITGFSDATLTWTFTVGFQPLVSRISLHYLFLYALKITHLLLTNHVCTKTNAFYTASILLQSTTRLHSPFAHGVDS
jgi:hypothetical protein